MQRNVRARPGVLRRRQIVGIGLARHLEHNALDRLGQCWFVGEPLRVGPGLQQGLGVGVTRLEFLHHVMQGIENQRGVRQRLHCIRRQGRIVQQIDQGMHVVAAEHGAQHLHGVLTAHQRRCYLALGDIGQERGLDIGRLVHAGRNAVFQQVDQEVVFALRWVLDEFHQSGNLFGIQGQRRQALRRALGNVGAIGFKHGSQFIRRK